MDTHERLLQPERLARIRSLLERETTMKVSELSELCGVSENTIRRDLIELESQGFCSRTKGGATRSEQSTAGISFEKRHGRHRENKQRIARKAAELVHSGSTVIIDSGTTGVELARELAGKQHITVITPSLAAANILAGIPEITLILPGGIMNPASRSLTGTPAEEFFASIHADLLFLAVKAVSIEGGLTDHNIAETSVKRSMISCADEVVVLADHSKIGRTALSRIADIDAASVLITDELAAHDELQRIRERNITVVRSS